MWLKPLKKVAASAVAFLLVCAVIGAPLVVFTPQAQAAVNDRIVVTINSLVKSNARGEESDGLVRVEENLKMAFTWDATAANPQPGEQFTIQLPQEFKNHQHPLTIDLEFANSKVGECQIAERLITCTFNEGIRGHQALRGTGSAILKAIQTTQSASVDIIANGRPQSVPTPGNMPIGPQIWNPTPLYKFGEPINLGDTSLRWSVGLGGAKLKEYFNQNAPQTVTFEDILAEGHIYDDSDPEYPYLVIGATRDNASNWAKIADRSGALNHTWGTHTISNVTVSPDKKRFSISFTGQWNENANYIFYYKTKPQSHNGQIQPGFKYENTVKLLNTDQSVKEASYYADSFTINITMEQGFGSFKVQKFLAGPKAGDVASDTRYPVKVAWKLPAGTTAANYNNWNPPANPYVVNAEAGKTIQPNVVFPVGTTLTLTEDLNALPRNVGWQAPVFSVNTVTIENQKSTHVELTNTAIEAPVGTFKVRKAVNGGPVADANFRFTYTCSDGQSGELSVPASGAEVSPQGKTFPIGTTCEITEDEADARAKFPGYVLTQVPARQTITVRDNAATEVATFTNNYDTEKASFVLKKVVSGEAPADFKAAAKKFTVAVTCGTEPAVNVELPGDGTAVRYPHEVPVGTVCTVVEDGANVAPTPYTNVTSYSTDGRVTIVAGQTPEMVVTNTYTLPKGTFGVSKTVEGDKGTAQDKRFTFNYSCVDAVTQATIEGTLEVPGNGTTVPAGREFPIGTTCTVTENAASAALAGFTLAPVAPKTVRISADSATVPLAFVNTYSEDLGNLVLSKKLIAEAGFVPPAEGFNIAYSCTDGTKGVEKIADQASVTIRGIKAGAVCTVTEADASVKGYALATVYTVLPQGQASSEVTIVKDQDSAIQVTNTYTPKKGAFSVTKTVEGDAGSLVTDKTFEFEYTCVGLDGKQTAKESFTLKNGEVKQVTDIREGTCTVVEKNAGVNNTDLTTVYQIDGKNTGADQAQVTVVERSTPAVSVRNTYTLHRGDFAVLKKVEGDDADAIAGDKQFSFSYVCSDGTKGVIDQVKGDGKLKPAGLSLPVGTTCEVSEEAESAARDQYDVAISDPVTVTIGHNTVVEAAFTNTYARHMGTFSVVKSVKGAKDLSKVFTFDYVCTDGTKGSLKAKGDGVSIASNLKLPTGTSCTITEDAQTAEIQGYTLTPAAPVTLTISEKNQEVVANFVNTYTEVPNPKIARTGADTIALAFGAGLTLLLGGVAIALFRRKA